MRETTLDFFFKIINWSGSRKVISLVISDEGLNRIKFRIKSCNAGRTYNLFVDKVRSSLNDGTSQLL